MMTGLGPSGQTCDFFAYDATSQVWNGAAFASWSDGSYTSYRITATETGTSGNFTGTLPAGAIRYELRLRGASLAASPVLWSDFAAIQTGDSFARIGSAGVGLTAVGLTASQSFNNSGQTTKLAATIAAGDLATDSITAAALKTDAVTEIQQAVAAGSVASVVGAVGSIATGGIAAASFAAGAIDNAAIATDAIGSAEVSAAAVTKIQAGLSTYAGGAVASVTGNVGGNVAGSVGSVASGGIAAASFAAGAIDAAAIATDAIGANEISAAAVTKIQAGLSTYAGGAVASVTGNVGGNLLGSVASLATDAISAASVSTAAVNKIQNGLSTLAQANLNALLASIQGASPETLTSIIAAINGVPTAAANRQEMDSNSTQLQLIADNTQDLPTLIQDGDKFTEVALSLAPTGGGSGGVGAYQVLVQFSPALEGIHATLTLGITSYSVDSDSDGLATFNGSIGGAYTLRAAYSGYSFTPMTGTISDDTEIDAVLTPVVIPAPSTPGLCAVGITCFDGSGQPVEGVVVSARLHETSIGTISDALVSKQVLTATSDSDGQCVLVLIQKGEFNPDNSTNGVYYITIPNFGNKYIQAPNQTTAQLTDIINP